MRHFSAFAAIVWLNDVFLDTAYGKYVQSLEYGLSVVLKRMVYSCSNNLNVIEETDDVFVFPDGSINVGGDNVITIVQVRSVFVTFQLFAHSA